MQTAAGGGGVAVRTVGGASKTKGRVWDLPLTTVSPRVLNGWSAGPPAHSLWIYLKRMFDHHIQFPFISEPDKVALTLKRYRFSQGLTCWYRAEGDPMKGTEKTGMGSEKRTNGKLAGNMNSQIDTQSWKNREWGRSCFSFRSDFHPAFLKFQQHHRIRRPAAPHLSSAVQEHLLGLQGKNQADAHALGNCSHLYTFQAFAKDELSIFQPPKFLKRIKDNSIAFLQS